MFALPRGSFAHSRWAEPPSRTDEDFLTDGPCGGAPVGARTQLVAGESVDVRWVLTQNHSSVFRIAFSAQGDEGFDDWVLGTRPDEAGVLEFEQALPMPQCICSECTLQLLQYASPQMTVAYHSCADIELTQPEGGQLPDCTQAAADSGTGADDSATGGDDSATGAASEDGGDATTGEEPVGSDGNSEPAASEASSGCRAAERESAPSVWLWLFVLASIRRSRLRGRGGVSGRARARTPAGSVGTSRWTALGCR
ncbi:MAG: DUF6595 domain-containing protein [Myxococcota bacterium]